MAEITRRNISDTKIKMVTQVGFMTALICVLGPLSIPLPFGPVPLSMGNFAVLLVVYVGGMRVGSLSCLIYLLIGFAGMPVFSSFTSGPGKLLGPTGGYLIGYILMAFICGVVVEKWPKNIYVHFIGMVVGAAACDLLGTAWLAYQAHMSFSAALAVGVIPFIPGDLAKIIIAILAGSQIRQRLQGQGML